MVHKRRLLPVSSTLSYYQSFQHQQVDIEQEELAFEVPALPIPAIMVKIAIAAGTSSRYNLRIEGGGENSPLDRRRTRDY